MAEEKELRRYILARFVLTLLAVGFAQMLINILFSFVIGPFLFDILELDVLGQDVTARTVALIAFELLVLFLLQIVSPRASFILSSFFETTFQNLTQSNISISTLFERSIGVAGLKGTLYPLIIILCFLLCVIIWLLPYIFAAISFSKAVSKRFRLLEEKRMQKDLEQIKQRNLLLSDIAHDIKTPITTIAGFSQALSDGTVEKEKMQEYLSSIYDKSMKTVELVTLLFEYVKLESEGYVLHKTTEDIYEIVRECVANNYTDFEDKEMEVDINIPEEAYYMQVDRIQMERALSNLLVNAWKHNDKYTHIWIEGVERPDYIYIRIYDNGKMIESDTAAHLFDPFVQGDKSRTGKRGSGLGLSITRKIIEMHNGKIQLMQKQEDNPIKMFEIQLMKEK